jgi:hypothetical protein
MTPRSARRLLWIALLFTAPVPFFLVETGAVPVVRLLLLAGVHVAVIATEGAQGAVGIAAALLAAQAILAAGVLWGMAAATAAALARLAPRRMGLLTLLLVAGVLGLAASVDLYRTPFRTASLRGGLFEIFD